MTQPVRLDTLESYADLIAAGIGRAHGADDDLSECERTEVVAILRRAVARERSYSGGRLIGRAIMAEQVAAVAGDASVTAVQRARDIIANV